MLLIDLLKVMLIKEYVFFKLKIILKKENFENMLVKTMNNVEHSSKWITQAW